jgi:hypothetical protein
MKFKKGTPQLAFKDIWRHHPELQNWSSSSWWFFLLLPKQEQGYGPKQMMFTFASRVGELIKVNQTWQKGIDPDRKLGKTEEFMTTVVGWVNDGKNGCEHVVDQAALAKLSYANQSLQAWSEDDNGFSYGGGIKAINSSSFEIEAHFKGRKGEGRFNIWSAGDSEIDTPQIFDFRGPVQGKLGGTQLVAWRRFEFSGEFTSPSGTEEHSGIGYFQRVLMNVPMFPWKWAFMVFENGSTFSAFIPYFGLQLLRRGDKFFKQVLERMVLPIAPGAYFYDTESGVSTIFDTSTILPVFNESEYPNFLLECKSKNGDFIRMKLESHSHAQFLLDRRIVKFLYQSAFNYNEYLYKVTKIQGSIDGVPFNKSKYGQAWGNMEYTWGMSI